MNYTRNILIFVITLTLAGIGVYAFVFSEVSKTSRKTEEIEKEIAKELEKQNEHSALQELLESTAAKREELLARVLNEGSLVRFFEEIEGMATAASVEMEITRIQEHVELDPIIPEPKEGEKNPKPRPHPNAKHLEWLQMDISATGSWSSVYRFLSLLELMPYKTQFSNVRLEITTPERAEAEETEELAEPWLLTLTVKVLKIKEK